MVLAPFAVGRTSQARKRAAALLRPARLLKAPLVRTASAANSGATAARALFARLGLVHGQRAAAVVLAVLGSDRRFRLDLAAHFHEPEALAATRITIAD